MKHFKLKVFVLIGILLLSLSNAWILIYYPQHFVRLSSDDISVTERFLKKKGITIEKDVVPKKIKSMPIAIMTGTFGSSNEIADIIFGEDYEFDAGTSYKNNVRIKLSPGISIKANPPALTEEFKGINLNNAAKKIRSVLDDYNFDIADSILETYEGENNSLNIIATQKYADYPVFNNSLRFTVSEKGLSSVTGLWFEPDTAKKNKHLPKSPVDVLIEFASDKNNEGTHIISVTQGYRLGTQSQESQQAELIPTWRILTKNGEAYFID